MHDSPSTDSREAARRKLVVYVASETLGRGDEGLGHTLMAAFLDTLAQLDDRVTHAIFINGGARLTMEGSPVLEQIGQLEQLGAAVLTCGTCLKHFGSPDQLAVGSVSNMFAILQTLAGADRIIRP